MVGRSRNLRQLGEANCVSKGYQMLPHSLTKKKHSFSPIPFTRLCSCGCFPVCRHLHICMAFESVVGQNARKENAMDPDPTTTHSRTFPKFHSMSTITTAGRHCGLGPGCAR